MPTGNPSPARRHVFALAVAGVLVLALAACHPGPPPAGNATPERAVATNLRMTATGDFDGLMQNRLPPADYAAWRKAWDKQHAHPLPVSVAQQKQFAKIMQMLTEPDAEAKLAKQFGPLLASLHGGKGERVPIFGSILEASLKQMIAGTPQLGPAQRKLAAQGIDALMAWAKTVDFSDPKQAKKAIALICTTARQLHVQTLKQWRALDYATTMRDYGILWNGVESLLHIYGLDLGKNFNQAKVTTLSNQNGKARIKLDMTLAGQPLTAQWDMRELAGHWYDAALLDAWRKAHPAAPASAASAAAPAGSVAAAPAPGLSTQPAPASTAAASKGHQPAQI